MKENANVPLFGAQIVLDTNIIMDMLHFADRTTAPLLAALHERRLEALTDPECQSELERVLTYPEFRLAPEAQATLLARYLTLATVVPAEPEEQFNLPRCRDADDQKFLILAARAKAVMLVTRDKLLLRLAQHKRIPPPCPIVKADEACLRLGLTAAPPD